MFCLPDEAISSLPFAFVFFRDLKSRPMMFFEIISYQMDKFTSVASLVLRARIGYMSPTPSHNFYSKWGKMVILILRHFNI